MNMMPPYLLKQIKQRLENHKRLLPSQTENENFLPGDPALAVFTEKLKGRASELEWVLNIIHTEKEKSNGQRKTKSAK